MRIALSIFSGIIVNFLVIFGVELLTHALFEVPALAPNAKPDYSTSEFSGLLVMIFIAHILGLFVGLLVSKKIETNTSMPLFFVSLSMIVGSLVNVAMIPHPLWFGIIDPLGLIVVAFLMYQWKGRKTA